MTESFPPLAQGTPANGGFDGGGGNRTRATFPPLKVVRSPFHQRCDAAWKADQGFEYAVSCAARAQADELERGTRTYIYIVRDISSDAVKIGLAIDPVARLAALQIGTPLELELIDYAPGTPALERFIHRVLGAHRVRGEWFATHAEVLVVCEMLMSAGDLRRDLERLGDEVSVLDTVGTFCFAAEMFDEFMRDNPLQLSLDVVA